MAGEIDGGTPSSTAGGTFVGVGYSTLEAFRLHWSGLPAELESEATQKLIEASVEIQALYPDTDERIAAGSLKLETVQLVVHRMVKRALDTPDDDLAGATSATSQVGPFAQTLNFVNPDATMYLSAADKRLLNAGRNLRQAWTILPGA